MKFDFYTWAFSRFVVFEACLLLAVCACGSPDSGPTTVTDRQAGPSPSEEAILTPTPTPKPKPNMSAKIPLELTSKYSGQPGITHITWTTESEKDSFGFNVMRSTVQNGPFTPANEDPILGAAGSSSTKKEYEFFDTHVKVGDGYYYYMQQIDLEGRKTEHMDWMKFVTVNHLNLDKIKGNPLAADLASSATANDDAPTTAAGAR